MSVIKNLFNQFDRMTEQTIAPKANETIQPQRAESLTLTISQIETFAGLRRETAWNHYGEDGWLNGEIDIRQHSTGIETTSIEKIIESSIIRPSRCQEYKEWIKNNFNKEHDPGVGIFGGSILGLIEAYLFARLFGQNQLLNQLSMKMNLDTFHAIISVILVGFFAGINIGVIYFLLKKRYKQQLTELLERLQPTRLGILLDEVDKYNRVVSHVSVMDQLAEVGHKGIQDRERILDVLKSMREDLIRALQTDRILRENPGFKPELISSEAIPLLETLKLSENAKEAQQLVQEAIDIGLRVQQEMKSLSES